jgi:shikimate kinase / 3-dehydroquinate synthase
LEAVAPARSLVFIGFMGAGKSTAARLAGEALGRPPVDTDAELERRLGTSIPEYFSREGEAAFRAREEEVVLELLAGADGAPVALGGGSVLSERVREALGEHVVVLLDPQPDTAWARAAGQERPLARDRAEFDALHAERAHLYDSLADAVLPGEPVEILPAALGALGALHDLPGVRLLWARSASGSYPVWVGRGLLERGFYPLEGRRFLVTDGNVGRLYGAALQPLLGTAAVMPGEQSKTLAHAEIVWTEMARHGVTRSDHVAALGGGVVGDLGGFCAATYQRGLPVVHVPTTLVAQVDSAYGGKTGIDLAEAKNYVGAYHQPAAVLVDPATLESLPPEELAAGYAEVIKTGLITGGPLWDRVRSGADVDEDVIVACARTKLAIVAEDERDSGRRQVLNLGHTVAHAIETATGYARYRHGEAVGLGLLAALRLSGQEDLRDQVLSLLAERGLPTRLEGAEPAAVAAATAADKKRRGEGPVPFVLVDGPGSVHPGRPVQPHELEAALKELA